MRPAQCPPTLIVARRALTPGASVGRVHATGARPTGLTAAKGTGMGVTKKNGRRERTRQPPSCGDAAVKHQEAAPAAAPGSSTPEGPAGTVAPGKASRLTRCAEVAAMVAAGCGLILATAKLVEVFLG